MNYQRQLEFWRTQIGDDGQEPVKANNSPAVAVPAQPVQTLTIQQSLESLAEVAHDRFAGSIQYLLRLLNGNVGNVGTVPFLVETSNNVSSFWEALSFALLGTRDRAVDVSTYFANYILQNHKSRLVTSYVKNVLDTTDSDFDYVSSQLGYSFQEFQRQVTNSNVPNQKNNYVNFAYAIGAIRGNLRPVESVLQFITEVLKTKRIHMIVFSISNGTAHTMGSWPQQTLGYRKANAETSKCICMFMTGAKYSERFYVIEMLDEAAAQAELVAPAPVAPAIMGGAMQDFKRAKLFNNIMSTSEPNYANYERVNKAASYGNQHRELKDTNELRGGVTHRIAKRAKRAEPVRSSAVELYKSAVAAWRHACMITSQPTSPFGARFSKHCRPTDMTDFAKYVDWAYRHVVLQGLAMPTELAGKHDKLVAKYVGADLSTSLVLKECRTLVVEIMAGKAVFRYLASTDIPTFCWLVSPGLYKLASQVFSNNYSNQTSQARWLAKQARTTKLFDRQDHKAGPTELVQTKQLVSTNKHAGQLPVLWLDKSTSQTKQTKQTEKTVHDFKRVKHAHPNHASHMWQAVLYCQDRKAVSSQLAFANQSKAAQLPNLAAMLAKMPGFFWKDLLGWKSKQIDFELLAKLVMIG